MRPSVEPTPIRAIDQRSATISEIQRSQSCQASVVPPAFRLRRGAHGYAQGVFRSSSAAA